MRRARVRAWAAFALGALLLAATTALAQPPETAPRNNGSPPASQPAPLPPSSPQPTPPQPTPLPPSPSAPAGEANGLQTFYLRDAKGALVPVVGMTFEEFEALLQLKKGLLPPEPPRYALDRLTITGAADDLAARVTAVLEVRVRGAGWTEIPLGLAPGALLAAPKYAGGGEQWFVADEKLGFRLWLKGESQPHRVELSFALPVQLSGQLRRVEWTLPRAAESSWKLQVSGKQLAASSRGAEDGVLAVKNVAGDKYELQLTGASGAVQLAWQPGDSVAGGRSLLEALGEIRVLVEGKNRLRSEARLKVRDLAQPLSSFRVRLPPGMRLAPETTAGYRVASIDEKPPSTLGRLVEVQLDRPVSAAAAEVQLSAESDPAQPESNLRPARFEVLGAFRQRGVITCAVDGDFLLTWTEDAAVRRTDLSAPALAARFEYFQQPCDLRLAVGNRPSRVIAEPSYRVAVAPQAVELIAEIRCQVRGPRTATVAFSPNGWKVAEVRRETGQRGRIEAVAQGAKLLLPLTDSVDEQGEARFVIQARLDPAPAAGTPLRFGLPSIETDAVSPATLTLAPAENLALAPRPAELIGLQLEPGALALSQSRSTLVYRERGDAPPQFVADMRPLGRRVAAHSTARVQIEPRLIQVEQELHFQIDYEPLSQLTLVGPSGETELLALQIVRQNDPIEPALTEAAPDPAGPRQWTLSFREPVLGPVSLVARFSVARSAAASSALAPPGAALALAVPLFTPAVDEAPAFRGAEVAVRLPPNALEEFADPPATEDALDAVNPAPTSHALKATPLWSVTQTSTHARTYRTPQPASQLPLWLRPTADLEEQQLLIQRACLTTLLAGAMREDHAAWRILTDRDFVEIRLPADVDPADLIAAVDGKRAVRAELVAGRLRIPLGPGAESGERLVELWTRAPRRPVWSADQIALPVLLGGRIAQSTYWELLTPPGELVLLDPTGFASDMHWSFQGGLFARTPNRSPAELAAWLGAPAAATPPRTNRYLFQALGRPEATTVLVTPQQGLGVTLALSGLVGGLLLLYVPRLRSPALLAIAAVVLAGLGLLSLDFALWAGQFLAAGAALALLALALRWMLGPAADAAPPPPPLSAFTRPRHGSSVTAAAVTAAEPAAAPLSTAPPGEVVSTGTGR